MNPQPQDSADSDEVEKVLTLPTERAIRWPFVRRSRLRKADRRASMWREKYDEVWLDHLSRCDCHDSWDQCEHTASGRHSDTCGCCRWC